jgi:hypothetical protein
MIEATMRERLSLKIDLGCLSRRDCDELVRAMFADGDVGDELTFAPLLLDEMHPPVVASNAGDDSGGPDSKPAPGQRYRKTR